MYHSITIVGYLGRDPEMRYTPAGKPQTTFSVASSRKYSGNSGEQIEETTWFRVTVFGGQAEACNQYLKKGRPVLVVGRLRPDNDTGGPKVYQKQNGDYAASFEVVADTVRFLGSGDGESGPSNTSDIPF